MNMQAIIQDLINGREEQARVKIHEYFVAKTRSIQGVDEGADDRHGRGEGKWHDLPAGTYFIGDPCYVFTHDKWSKLLDDNEMLEHGEVVTFDGHKLYAGSTAHGDGTYTGSDGVEYSVDAGLIGATPIDLADEKIQSGLGKIYHCPNGLTVKSDNGNFSFDMNGKTVEIMTDGSDEDDEDSDHYGDHDDHEEDDDEGHH